MNRIIFAALLALSTPAMALEDAQLEAAHALHAEISDMISQGFDKDIFTQAPEANAIFLDAAGKARAGIAAYGDDPEMALELRRELGIALFYAAQYHDHEPDDAAARWLEIEWLSEALPALDEVVAALGPLDGPSYELRGAAGQLFDHAAYLEDPRWREWSSAYVRGNRAMLGRLSESDDTAFERNMLAQALYQDGFLTGSAETVAEADALAAGLGKRLDYRTERMRDAVAAGEAPYPPPGEAYW